MTMMMTDSQFGLGDMEALLWEPSSPMADPTGPLHPHSDPAEEPHGPGGPLSFFASSLPSSSSSPSASSLASSPPFYSPPASPASLLLHGDKAGLDVFSLPWLAPSSRLGCIGMDMPSGKEGDTFCDLDWMTERIDLSELDLSSEALLASLDCPLGLDSLPTPAPPPPPPPPPAPLSPPPPACLSASPSDIEMSPSPEPASPVDRCDSGRQGGAIPEPQQELEIKSEPVSPEPAAYTLDLGSEVEVEVNECEVKPMVVVVALPAAVVPLRGCFLVLPPKDQAVVAAAATTTVTATIPAVHQSSASSSLRASTTSPRPQRCRPYPNPSLRSPGTSGAGKVHSTRGSTGEADGSGNTSSSSSSSSSSRSSSSSSSGGSRRLPKAPKDKKLKKMEQNKTAATRYRQKKRVEQESLSTVYSALERRNIELNEKADSMAREIQYLKELMEEVRTARLRKGLGADL